MRLAWAMAAALLFHILLMACSDWRMESLIVPSNQDRVITMSLEKTLLEGLKDAEQQAKETITTPNVGKPLSTPSNPSTQTSETTSKQRETAPAGSPTVEVQVSDHTTIDVEEVTSRAVTVAPESHLTPVSAVKTLAPRVKQKQAPVEATSVVTNKQRPVYLANQESDVALVKAHSLRLSLEEVAPLDVHVRGDALLHESPEAVEGIAPRASRLMPLKQQRALEKMIQNTLRKSRARSEFDKPVEWEHQGQRYTAKFHQLNADSDMGIDRVQVDVVTEKDGKHLTSTLRLKKLAFSNFAQFVNQWDNNTAVHDDQMNGRFHSNTEITFASDRQATPVFHGKVTTAAPSINRKGRLRNSKVFMGGLETRVKRIGMPNARTLMPEGRADKSVTITIEQESHIRFTKHGEVFQQAVKQHGPPKRHLLGAQSTYIVAAPKTALHVSGVVSGIVSVYSPKRIVIEGHIRYAKYGPPSEGGDFLGLISGKNVIVAGRDVIADGDLDVQASVYARGRFGVKQIKGKRSGTLTILGSLSVGTLTATEPRYATKVIFDQRLEDLRPPSFPVTDRYELIAQQQRWRVEKSSPFYEIGDVESDVLSLDSQIKPHQRAPQKP